METRKTYSLATTVKNGRNDSVMEQRDKSVRRELLFVPRQDGGRERKGGWNESTTSDTQFR